MFSLQQVTFTQIETLEFPMNKLHIKKYSRYYLDNKNKILEFFYYINL